MLIPEPRIPTHELRPDDSELVAAAQVILLEDLDDAPLVRAGVMGGQGRSAGSMAFYCPNGYGECEDAQACCYPGRCSQGCSLMGGQGRSAGSIRDTAMLTGYVLLVGVLYLAAMWAIQALVP